MRRAARTEREAVSRIDRDLDYGIQLGRVIAIPRSRYAAPQSYLPRGFCQDRPPIFVTYFEIIETQSQRLRQRSAGSAPLAAIPQPLEPVRFFSTAERERAARQSFGNILMHRILLRSNLTYHQQAKSANTDLLA
jgi:hypothetical protein